MDPTANTRIRSSFLQLKLEGDHGCQQGERRVQKGLQCEGGWMCIPGVAGSLDLGTAADLRLPSLIRNTKGREESDN